MEEGQPHTSFSLEPFWCCIMGGMEEGKHWSHLRAAASLLCKCQRAAKKQRADACCHARNQAQHPRWDLSWCLWSCKHPPQYLTCLWDVPVGSVVQSINLESLGPVISFHVPPARFILFTFQHIGVSEKPAQLTLIENEKWSSIREGGKAVKTNSILSYCFCIYLTAVQISSPDSCCSS